MLLEVPNAFAPYECEELIRDAERLRFSRAPAFFLLKQDSPALAAILWRRLKSSLSTINAWRPVSVDKTIRFYRYAAGDRFTAHQDGALKEGPTRQSMFSVVLYLNQGFVGGATHFHDLRKDVVPQTGLAIAFPHSLIHSGEEVIAGTKYVLRADVMFER